MIEWIPNKIFGSNTGSFDRSADQTAPGYVNTPINNHIITTLGFSQKKKWKILESRELRETRRRRRRRRQWRWQYRWRRRCRGTPLRGRGPTCPDMLLCSTFRSDPICSQMWFWFLNLSMLFCWFLLFFFLWKAFGARSLSLAHSGSLDSYATQCVRMCDWIWWTFGPLLWIFFFRETALCFGVELIKKREKWNGNVYEGDKIKISTEFY